LSFLLEFSQRYVKSIPMLRGADISTSQIVPDVHATTRWTAAQLATLAHHAVPEIPLIAAADVAPAIRGLMLWDMWPVQHADGSTLIVNGGELWVIMSAPSGLHPDKRHDVARLRLALWTGGEWQDHGDLLPEGLNPGAREWAGSTVYDAATGKLTLFYTATGRRGECVSSYEQRLFQTEGNLVFDGSNIAATGWSEPFENVISDDHHYVIAREADGQPGFIKAFRDPYHFRDPADGADYLLFTASLKQSGSDYNGAVGIARAHGNGFDAWQLLPPLLSADNLNNEMERPVLRVIDGRYYCFWSTQRRTFAPGGPSGPNGLYGMVADSLFGEYRPLNGSGLVAANPAAEPFQTYSWWVTHDLEVAGFIDHWGLKGRALDEHPDLVVSQFGGTPAPRFHIALSGDTAHIVTA
jgi:levansucrase